jgi:hypothetical protein
MRIHTRSGVWVVVSLVWICGGWRIPAADAQLGDRPPPVGPGAAPVSPAAVGMATDVLTHGPLHEAFAEPVNTGKVASLIIPKRPPDAIGEVAPDAKPADEGAIWIAGYWTWDDERKDFIWASGLWRVPPPGHRWVAGYWAQVPNGYQWAPGFWIPTGSRRLTYYPEPPTSAEHGPTGSAPSPDKVWNAAYWHWGDGCYECCAGSWVTATADWIWTAPSYYWSPTGWVFVDGYWDYPLERRGMLFAPVSFDGQIYRRPGFSFSPAFALDTSGLPLYLFVRPNYAHYYFGDYFAAANDDLGIYPWYAAGQYASYNYDPLFSFYAWWYQGSNPGWAGSLRGWHDYYRANPDQRPPRDLASQIRLSAEAVSRADGAFLTIARPLEALRDNPEAPLVARVPDERRIGIQERTRLAQDLTRERSETEQLAATGGAGASRGLAGAADVKRNVPFSLDLPMVATTLGEQPAWRNEPMPGPTWKPDFSQQRMAERPAPPEKANSK